VPTNGASRIPDPRQSGRTCRTFRRAFALRDARRLCWISVHHSVLVSDACCLKS